MRFPSCENQIKGGSEKFGWALAIVPFMESNNLVARVSENEPWDSLNNSFVLARSMPFYSSPLESKPYNLAGYGMLNYAACAEVISGDVGIVPGDDFERSQYLYGEICDGYEPWAKPGSCRSFGNGIRVDTSSFGSPAGRGAFMARADGKVEFVSSSISPQSQTFRGQSKQSETGRPDSYGYELILKYSPVLKGWRANCWFAPRSKSYGRGKALNDEGLKQLVQDDGVVALILGGAHEVTADGLAVLKGSAVTRLEIDERIGIKDEEIKLLHGMKQLKYLALTKGKFSDDAIGQLRLALPECTVVVR